jgi:hypothetical protein
MTADGRAEPLWHRGMCLETTCQLHFSSRPQEIVRGICTRSIEACTGLARIIPRHWRELRSAARARSIARAAQATKKYGKQKPASQVAGALRCIAARWVRSYRGQSADLHAAQHAVCFLLKGDATEKRLPRSRFAQSTQSPPRPPPESARGRRAIAQSGRLASTDMLWAYLAAPTTLAPPEMARLASPRAHVSSHVQQAQKQDWRLFDRLGRGTVSGDPPPRMRETFMHAAA